MAVKIFAFADEAGSDFETQISAMKENNLSGIEIRNVDGMSIADISEQKARELKKRLDDENLVVWSIGSPYGKIGIDDDFETHLEKFKRTLDVAKILDAECFRLFSFYLPSDKNFDDYKNEVIDKIGKFCDAASGYEITLCHENEKGIYGDLAPRCLEIHKALPSVKGIFDPANFVQCGQDTLEAWKILKPYIKYMHIKDALKDGSVVPAGKGIGNVKAIADDFLKNGGTAFTIEPHLSVFDGLEKLEKESGRKNIVKFVYDDSRVAFNVACEEFKKLVNTVTLSEA